MEGPNVRERKRLIAAIVVVFVFYFTIEKLLVSTGEYPFAGAQLMQNLLAALLVPMAYLLYAFSFGLVKSVRHFWNLLLIAAPMVLDVVATIVDICHGTQGVISSRHSYIHFEISTGNALEMQMFSFIIMCQTVYVFVRVISARKLFVHRRLSLSQRGHGVVRATIIICCWVFLTLLPPHSMLVDNHILDAIICGYSVTVTAVILIIASSFNSGVVVDAEKNVVSIEDDADSTLAEAIRLMIKDDKVYRNSNLRIEDLAAMVSSNRTYVARICRVRFGKTFTELMNYHRVEDAKAMLASDRTKRMEEVAAECGFSSASFFARVFKANVGMTPTQWRQQKLGKTPMGLVKKSVGKAVDGEES
ncbi:MAG: helix-turn-helix domain-containing protein [Bacteroidales bacterium]|nr:helix-turn-helix domain-containing protein [Bacteroidales bacterium]